MTEEERRKQGEELAGLKEQMAKKDQRIEELEAYLMRALLRIEELERRLGKDSHNSSKPPSSDGLGRKPGKARKKSEKRSGGQKGHQGTSLLQVLTPVEVTSSDFPRYDRNLNTGEAFGTGNCGQIANNTVFSGGSRASHILLPICSL